MTRDLDSKTYSDSPWFFDPSKASLPQSEATGVQSHNKKRVAYFHPKDVGNYHYGVSTNPDTKRPEEHPMRPHRLELTNQLVMGYKLDKCMSVHSPRMATEAELAEYHSLDYLDFLKRAQPSVKSQSYTEDLQRFSPSDDCPIFDNIFSFCRQYAGASLAAARKLGNDAADVAINWSGGLHHAKKSHSSGFCYINDIVLAILQLLRTKPRILYIDIDAHHGDGVQEAFYRSNRVMTVSFHKYGSAFFPFTGRMDERGDGLGKHFALNVPLRSGIQDHNYLRLFKAIMEPVIQKFRPSAIVLQCGADSLAGDRLGPFNLSIKAHGECVQFIKNYNLPLLVLGGGGYRQSSVARCWAYETGIITGSQLDNNLPLNNYYRYYGPDYTLHPELHLETEDIKDANTPTIIERIRILTLESLRYLDAAPSVQMQEIPPDLMGFMADEERDKEELREMEDKAMGGEYREDSKLRNGDLLEEEVTRAGKTSRRY